MRRLSHNILMELPHTIPEHTEMHVCGSSISLPTPPLSADSTENQCPTTTTSSSSCCSIATGNNANDRRSRRIRMTERRFSEPPMLMLQKMSTLRICYPKKTLNQERDEPDSQNDFHSSSSSICTSPKVRTRSVSDYIALKNFNLIHNIHK